MKNKLFRIILKIHKNLPFVPFEKKLIKFYHFFQEKEKIVEARVNGINYRLDLSELIDNKVFYGNWEPKTTSMFKKKIKPGMSVLDIGANIGYYTLLMGKLVGKNGKIISFEPTSGGFERLKSNVLRNNFKNIRIEKLALSNENKKIKTTIRHSWKLSGLVNPEAEIITMIKLDDYIKKNRINRVDFIKIDVDGYEYEILKGAKKCLEKYKPILCLEMGHYENKNPRYTLSEITSFLTSLGYSFYSEEGKYINSIQEVIKRIPNPGAENFFLF